MVLNSSDNFVWIWLDWGGGDPPPPALSWTPCMDRYFEYTKPENQNVPMH